MDAANAAAAADGLWFQPHSTTQYMNQRLVIQSRFQNTLLHILVILASQPDLVKFLGLTTFFLEKQNVCKQTSPALKAERVHNVQNSSHSCMSLKKTGLISDHDYKDPSHTSDTIHIMYLLKLQSIY
jgi:hypothetical protein